MTTKERGMILEKSKKRISYWAGKKLSKEHIERISIGHKGKNLCEKNGMWKGDNVGYLSLHEWVINRKIKPLFCEICLKEKKLELANISGKYKRDINDYQWLCRRCHMKSDGRLQKLIQRNKDKLGWMHCPVCAAWMPLSSRCVKCGSREDDG